jgi:hypothetical protein
MTKLLEAIRGLSYLGGLVALALAVVDKFASFLSFTSPRMLLAFAGVCFLCSLASKAEVAGQPKEEVKAKAAAA